MAILLPGAVREPPPGVAWSVCVRGLGSRDVLAGANADAVLPIASVGKLFLLAEVARRIEAGELAAGERLARTPEDAVADSGLWQHLAVEALTVGDLAALVGAVSDNLAANVLLRRVGLEQVQAATRALGMRGVALHDRVRDERGEAHPPTLASGSAAELSAFLAGPHGPAGERVLGWLAAGTDLSMVAAAFGFDPLAHIAPDRGLRLRNKTGTDVGVRADVGVLEGPARGVAYAVLAHFGDEHRDVVLGAMRAVGEALRAEVSDPGPRRPTAAPR